MVLVEETVIRRLQPAVPRASPGGDCRIRTVGVDGREVSAAGYVVLGRLERARPEVLEVLDAVFSVSLGIVQLHRR